VTRTSTNTCNSVAVKSLLKIVKYVEFLAKVCSTIAGNVVCLSVHLYLIICETIGLMGYVGLSGNGLLDYRANVQTDYS